jgi:cell division transport system ATP-binding protein
VEGVLAALAAAFMIQLSNVSKIYPPNAAALKGISLQIERGECVFVTGASGAGKTTLLKLLCCEEEPSEGQIFINGKDLIGLNNRGVARLRQQMGLLFQEFKFLPHMTALDNVALAGLVIGAPRRESYDKAYRLLRELGLQKKCNAKPPALSGGEQQRIAIARALINDPMVVLADEPTENLDAELAEETMRLFLKSRERGTTIMVASHDLDFSQRYRARVISLHQGCLVDDSNPATKKGRTG